MIRTMLLGGAAVAATAGAGIAHAAGFALVENSASGLGNAFAGVAAIANDASTVFTNPAGMTYLSGAQFTLAAHYIDPKADFSNKGSTTANGDPLLGPDSDGGSVVVVPNLYYVRPVAPNLMFGVGVNVPYGLETHYDDDWVGRYHAVQSELITININPSLAWKLGNHWSVGGGVSLQYANATFSSAIDLGSFCTDLGDGDDCDALLDLQPQQDDGFGEQSGDSWALGFNVGLIYALNERSRLGLAYRSQISHTLEGEADFTIPGELSSVLTSNVFTDVDVDASTTLPETVSLSVYHELSPRLAVMADWTWTRWSRFDELRIEYDNPDQPDTVTTQDWLNSNRYSIGVNYVLNRQWLLRGGVAYDETPIPDAQHRTPRVPGNDRRWLAFGVGYSFSDTFSIDVGYAHLFVPDTPIDHAFESDSSPALRHTVRGEFNSAVNILSGQLNWRF